VTAAPEDEDFVTDEEAEAAKEAAGIGGSVPHDTDDPAQQALIEGGEGESEGFELAEKELEDKAEHGDQHQFPTGTTPAEDTDDTDEYGEADQAIPADENE
jgi:hypothetical protein